MSDVDGQGDFLPGVPARYVLERLARAGGNEIESGKFGSPESSAALAVNVLGWFVERPSLLPPFPGVAADFPPERVEVEYCARFPWSGGRHPWLDAMVETNRQLIGVESKRFEPFRDRKKVSLAAAYDRPVWGDNMAAFEAMRDQLRSGERTFEYLDAAQLVKHAFGLVTDAARRGRAPLLLYLFAEPASLAGRLISDEAREQHRREIAEFGDAVAGAAVEFRSASYHEWLSSWIDQPRVVREHGEAVLARFCP